MAFHENAIFPTNISKGSRGGPIYRDSVLALDAGQPNIIGRWPTARRKYNLRYGIKRFSQLQVVHDFWLGRDGIRNGWRLFDLFDHSTASDHRSAPTKDDVNIGAGDGSTLIFQMQKKYTSFDQTIVRVIEKPISGTELVALDGALQTEITHYTIDRSSGEISFVSAPTAGQQVTWGGDYHTPCQFAPEVGEQFDVSIDAFEAGEIGDLMAVEMLGNTVTPDQPWRGVGRELALTADTLYDFSLGHALKIDPDADGHQLILPYIEDLDTGAPVFHFYNAHATRTIDFHNRSSGALEFTLPGATGAIVMVYAAGGTNFWQALKGI
jgi:uncharacterized protein (TIGR02217 family)